MKPNPPNIYTGKSWAIKIMQHLFHLRSISISGRLPFLFADISVTLMVAWYSKFSKEERLRIFLGLLPYIISDRMSRHLKGRSGIGGQVPIEIEKRQSLYAESISAELSRKRGGGGECCRQFGIQLQMKFVCKINYRLFFISCKNMGLQRNIFKTGI